jgi:hypothetical protein
MSSERALKLNLRVLYKRSRVILVSDKNQVENKQVLGVKIKDKIIKLGNDEIRAKFSKYVKYWRSFYLP